MLIDIVILPPKEIRESFGERGRQVMAGLSKVYLVDNIKLTPHLSLFHLRINKKDLTKLNEFVLEVSRNFKAFQIRSVKPVQYKKENIVYLRLSKPKKIVRLRDKVASKVKNLRVGPLFEWYKKGKFSDADRTYIKNFGSFYTFGKNFDPHLTIGGVKLSQDVPMLLKKFTGFKFKFKADTIAVCEVNNNCQVFRIIKEFKLKS